MGAVLSATPAAAHVRVDEGQQPPQGGYGIVRLIVPSESAQASTTGLTVTLPDNVHLTSARTLPIPGWRAAVETTPSGDGQRVSRITWQAIDKADGLRPSEFGEFAFSAGPWPENVDSVALLSDQAYSDGSVVSWNEIAVDNDSEPEKPAPVVALAPAEAGHSHTGDGHGAPSESATNVTAAEAGPGHHDASADTTLVAAESSGQESWAWRATSVVSLLIALATAAALAVAVRRNRS
ncbi:YcnI family protein [Mycobacterium sp. LTG2003]